MKVLINKFSFFSLFTLLAMLFPLTQANAKVEKWTICHHTQSERKPYIRISVPKQAQNGHVDANGNPLHDGDFIIDEGQQCPGYTPVVPEFGLMTGAMALMTSGGAFLYMKKGVAKK